MILPTHARALFEEGNELENTRIIAAKITDNDQLRLDLADETYGTFCITITSDHVGTGEDFLVVDYDEPIGAGADPYGRPDPAQHPESWTE